MGCVNKRMVSGRAMTFYITKFKRALRDLLHFMKIKKKPTCIQDNSVSYCCFH